MMDNNNGGRRDGDIDHWRGGMDARVSHLEAEQTKTRDRLHDIENQAQIAAGTTEHVVAMRERLREGDRRMDDFERGAAAVVSELRGHKDLCELRGEEIIRRLDDQDERRERLRKDVHAGFEDVTKMVGEIRKDAWKIAGALIGILLLIAGWLIADRLHLMH